MTDPRGFNDDGEDELSPLGAAATVPAGRDPGSSRPSNSTASKIRRRLPRLGFRLGSLGVVAAILLFAFVPVFLSGLKKTPRDRFGVSYGGGPFEGSHFQRIVQPGHSLFFNGFFDPLYLYPADQRNYIISKTVGVGSTTKSDSVVAPSNDRVAIEYQVAVYFKLDSDRLRAFHEQLGLKYKAYTNSGWNNLIQDTFRQQIENAIQQVTRRYQVDQIYGNAATLVTIQTQIQRTLSQRLFDALGTQFFCAPTFRPGGKCQDPTFIIKNIGIPNSVASAYQDVRISSVKIRTKTNEIAQRAAEARSITAFSDALAKTPSYVMLKAIESGSIKFWVLPSSTGLTLTTPDTGATSSAPSTPSTPSTTAPTTTTPTATTTAQSGAPSRNTATTAGR